MGRRRWRRELAAAALGLTVVSAVAGTPFSAPVTTAGAETPGPTVVGFGPGADSLGSSSVVDPDAPLSGIVSTPTGDGYVQYGPDGRVFPFGDAVFHGDLRGTRLNQPVVAGAMTPSGDGYWLVAGDGGVFTFGDAGYFGSTGDLRLNQPIVAAAATASGNGYWLVAADGGVFTFGDAGYFGSTGDLRLNQPVVTATATPSGRGYWLVAADGGVFTFGDAVFAGSAGDRTLAWPVDDMAADPDGHGYWLVASDGSVFAFGAVDHGSAAGRGDGATPAVGIAATPEGGYRIGLSPVRPLPRGGTRLFPTFRVVAFYGKPYAPVLGVLGGGSADSVAGAVEEQAKAYAAGGRSVLPAFEVITTVATVAPGPDGDYSSPIDPAVLDEWLAAARRHRMLLLLDLQPGRADFLDQARQYERWLAEPDVGLALDPEWSVRAPDRPGGGHIGSTDAATINRVSEYLAGLVRAHRLPEKLFVIHQFTRPMVRDKHLVVARPELATTFHADGFGSPTAKAGTYHAVRGAAPFWGGYKVFYRQDQPVPRPDEVLGLAPPPDLITYQ